MSVPSEGVVIDAHQHFWLADAQEQPWRRPEHHALERDFGVDDLVPELDQAGVHGSVLMQSVDEPAENLRLARYAAEPRVLGVVGWLPLRDPAAARRELATLAIPKLVGVRCLVADDPLDWLTTPESVRLFADLAAQGLSWDVVPITRAQIDAVIALARAVPELRVIIDHLGRPPIESAGWEPWASQLEELATCPNVAIKISIGIDALSSWGAWAPETIRRYVLHAYRLFGPERSMLASNWPIILLRTDYQTAWADLAHLLLGETAERSAQMAVMGGSARQWYRLPASSDSREEVISQSR